MAFKDPETIARQVLANIRSDRQRTRPVALGAIDDSKVFLPPEYTQLFYSPIWTDLDRAHRRRYSQLFALRTNEVIMLFERFLVAAVLPPMARRLKAMRLAALRQLVLEMQLEEEEHDTAFVALNRASRPDLYRQSDFFFFPPSIEVRKLVAIMGFAARWLAHPLWLLLLVEESSITIARDLAAMDESHELGSAEPNWLAVHREHTRDERRHIIVDRLLFESCYARRNRVARILDGWLFERILRAIIFPRANGAGVRVVDQLIRDYPELGGMRAAMIREIISLDGNPDFRASLLSQRLAPRAWELFHRCPELNTLGEWIPDYA